MSTNIAYTMTIRCQLNNSPGTLGRLATAIGDAGSNIGAIDIVRANRAEMVRDITVQVLDEAHGASLVAIIDNLEGITVQNVSDRIFLAHLGGKIAIHSKIPLKTRADLSIAYTPGVARVCSAIAADPDKVYALTAKRNTVAIVTDGSAVLGLGNIGPEASLPVMEGKAILFKELADIDAFPIALRSQDPDIIIQTIEQISPVFGGINLEDIAAPQCFEIERKLSERLDMPVMHDDQHGTAVVATAALLNALRVVGKRIQDVRVVVNGVGAAGSAIIRMLLSAEVGEVTPVDQHGILTADNATNPSHLETAQLTNQSGRSGDLVTALIGADVFIGVSVGNILSAEHVKIMAQDAIVFALANPIPEGDPDELQAYARIVATGRSDYPNQINNVLSFPGIFRGALNVQARAITLNMRLAAAAALANLIPPSVLSEDYIIPSVFNRDLVPTVAEAVSRAAIEDGTARRIPSNVEQII